MAIFGIESLAADEHSVKFLEFSPVKRSQGDFSTWLMEQVKETNEQIKASDINLRKLAMGEMDNLHQVMMSLEKAKTSFELVLQVRNRLLEGYQEILRMQI